VLALLCSSVFALSSEAEAVSSHHHRVLWDRVEVAQNNCTALQAQGLKLTHPKMIACEKNVIKVKAWVWYTKCVALRAKWSDNDPNVKICFADVKKRQDDATKQLVSAVAKAKAMEARQKQLDAQRKAAAALAKARKSAKQAKAKLIAQKEDALAKAKADHAKAKDAVKQALDDAYARLQAEQLKQSTLLNNKSVPKRKSGNEVYKAEHDNQFSTVFGLLGEGSVKIGPYVVHIDTEDLPTISKGEGDAAVELTRATAERYCDEDGAPHPQRMDCVHRPPRKFAYCDLVPLATGKSGRGTRASGKTSRGTRASGKSGRGTRASGKTSRGI